MLETVLRQGVLGEDDIGEESPRCVSDLVEQQFWLNVLPVLEIENLGQPLNYCLNTFQGYNKGKAILDIVYLNMHLAMITDEASMPKNSFCED